MELKKIHWIAIALLIVLIAAGLILRQTRFFFILIGLGIVIGISPFVFSIIKETKESAEKEEMFLEFKRNNVESVNTGTPISNSIINLINKS